jgi:hypothetical protein
MPERKLTDDEAAKAKAILDYVRQKLEDFASGDTELLHAYRRRIMNTLQSDERTSSMNRQKLKKEKYKSQKGLCAICSETLPEKYAVLDRLQTTLGYTAENTRLIHEGCDRRVQAERRYTRYMPPPAN